MSDRGEYIRGAFGGIYAEYPEVIRETDKYVEYKVVGYQNPTRERKFLCVGGPFDGCFYTRTQVKYACPGYQEFNNAGGSQHNVIFAWATEEHEAL